MIPKDAKARAGEGKRLFSRVFRTPLGWCGLVGGGEGLLNVVLPMSSRSAVEGLLRRMWPNLCPDRTVLAGAEHQVQEYFSGKRKTFDLPFGLRDRSPFESTVYAVTRRIPYGKTVTYGWIARKIGKPLAARAVGRALARNPLPLLAPCHRVVGSDGRLCGFTSEGGLALKKKLLDLERAEGPSLK